MKFAAEQLSERARKAYYAIKANFPANNNFSAEIMLKLYQSMIVPIITYGSEIWISDFKCELMSSDQFPFEKTQHLIFKDILGVHRKASNLAVLCELGRFPLYYLCYEYMFKYYLRLKEMECKQDYNNYLVLSAFKEDKNLVSRISWQKKLSSLLQKLNVTSMNISHTTLKYRLQEHYQNKIHEQLKNISKSDCGKLAFYSKIINQNEYKLQHYLRLPLKKCDRSVLTKLRISAHPLYIETGRYSKPPIPKEKRLCCSCRLFIEDEKHFVLYCSKYEQCRWQYNDLFNVNTYTCDDPIRKIVNPTNITNARRTCCYLKTCFAIRKESLQ